MKLSNPHKPGRVAGYPTRVVIFGTDAFLTVCSWLLVALLLHAFDLPETLAFLYGPTTFLLIGLRLLTNLLIGTNNLILRYIGEKDYKKIFFSVVTSSAIFILIWWIMYPSLGGFRVLGAVLLDTLSLLSLLVGMRIVLRSVYDRLKRPQRHLGTRVAIFGAGEMGSMLEHVLHRNSAQNYRVVAFFDDNPRVHRKLLNGIPIYNPARNFEQVISKYGIQTVIIGIRNLSMERRVAFIDACLALKLQVLKVPPTESWINGNLHANQLRKVNLEDLLSRPPIVLGDSQLRSSIAGKVIMVTGCAGSIGSEILRQLLKLEPACVVGVDQAESPLAELGLQLQHAIKEGVFVPVLSDIRDEEAMEYLYKTYQPKYVFHAAAYKHVPIMESFPMEAVRVNIMGTRQLADLAVKYKVEKFVMVSTDKAVNPANVMGASKRIAEIYVQALNFAEGHHTHFITTRFGNVLGSNGSVIPIFREQIENMQPVTVTHPDITRYFMTIPEACRLVLEAGSMGRGGEIFVFDMGEPVRILDLAKRMIQLAGLEPGRDIDIHFTGLRPGEKLYEELLDHKETLAETHHPKIFRAHVRPGRIDQIRREIDMLIAHTRYGSSTEELVTAMKKMVPEFVSSNSVFSALDK